MSLIKLNLNPDQRQLRQFGGIAFLGLPLLGWIIDGDTFAMTLCILSGIAAGISAWLIPGILKYPFVALSAITGPIGIVVGEIVLLFVYYCVFFPIGLWFRIMGRNRGNQKFDRSTNSYWTSKQNNDNVESYFRQF